MDNGLTVLVYTSRPSSPTSDALELLASWTATPSRTSAPDAVP